MIFCKLVASKKVEGPVVYELMEHGAFFFKDPELKNVLMIQLMSTNKELVDKVKEKLEPLLLFLLKSLEELKSEVAGIYARVNFTRPKPGWKDI
jgi:hypothetical protein